MSPQRAREHTGRSGPRSGAPEPSLRMSRDAEWLEADGLGGFASGTVGGERTRRYHALLLVATTPPTGRVALVNGLDIWIERGESREAISTQRYLPDVIHPDGASRLTGFELEPWPNWTSRLADGALLECELFVPHGSPAVVLTWKLTPAKRAGRLLVRPLLSGRDAHALHHENPEFDMTAVTAPGRAAWRGYASQPGVDARFNGEYRHDPVWYRNFIYTQEQARGLDHVEDLASPGELSFDLARGEAVLVLSAAGLPVPALREGDAASEVRRMRTAERRRRTALGGPLDRAADQYLVRRGQGLSIIAGYPWFTDWGRDTFIAMRGLCLATGRLDAAGLILGEWSGAESEGMLPNRFPEAGEAPEFNAVDASLWYLIAVHEYFVACAARGFVVAPRLRKRLQSAFGNILTGYAAGTRHGIRMDADELLACGEPGVQLTWMDARVGEHVITPRIGKPVEVQALWINALQIASAFAPRWAPIAARARAAFVRRFWYEAGGYLYDVVDVDHVPGTADATLRPNQMLALGGLPNPLIEGGRAHRVIAAVDAQLMTPLGLRTLSPSDPAYHGHYRGDAPQRDASYHQGTAWPWLIGAFVEAWVHSRGSSPDVKRDAYARFVTPLRGHLNEAGVGHLSEVADGDWPHAPGGCPFQAWSLGELLRLERGVLADRAVTFALNNPTREGAEPTP